MFNYMYIYPAYLKTLRKIGFTTVRKNNEEIKTDYFCDMK